MPLRRKRDDGESAVMVVLTLLGVIVAVAGVLVSYWAAREQAHTALPAPPNGTGTSTAASTTSTGPGGGPDRPPLPQDGGKVGVDVTKVVTTTRPVDPGTTNPARTPGKRTVPTETSLATDDRQDGPSIDSYCGSLGLAPHAWLPGQTTATAPDGTTSTEGRVLNAPDAAFTWSCTRSGRRLTRDDISQACQLTYPGTLATTWDRDFAYSWVCR